MGLFKDTNPNIICLLIYIYHMVIVIVDRSLSWSTHVPISCFYYLVGVNLHVKHEHVNILLLVSLDLTKRSITNEKRS